MTRRNPDSGKNNTSMALFFSSQSSAVSFTYFIIYSHIVPSKLVGVGLVFHKKAVKEAGGVEVRGPPQLEHPAGKGWGGWGWEKAKGSLWVGLWPHRHLGSSGQVHTSTHTRASSPASRSPGVNPTLNQPFSTHATGETFQKHLPVHTPFLINLQGFQTKPSFLSLVSIQGLLTCLTPIPGDTCHSLHRLHRASWFPATRCFPPLGPVTSTAMCPPSHALSIWQTPTEPRRWARQGQVGDRRLSGESSLCYFP